MTPSTARSSRRSRVSRRRRPLRCRANRPRPSQASRLKAELGSRAMFSKIAYGLSIGGTILTLALRIFGADDTLTFGVSAVTILGLAYTLGHATEQLGIAAGPRIGGIMNA